MGTEYQVVYVEWIETPKHEEYGIGEYMCINKRNIISIQNGRKGVADIFWMSDGSRYAVSEYYQPGGGINNEKI